MLSDTDAAGDEHDLRPSPEPRALPALLTEVEPSLAIVSGAAMTTAISGIELDSRRIRPSDLFVACPGFHSHGAHHIDEAIGRGAGAVLTDETGLTLLSAGLPADLPLLLSDNPRRSCARLAEALYRRQPSPTLLAVTGTNGKTSTVQMLRAGLGVAGVNAAVIGSLGIEAAGLRRASPLTTPEAPQLHAALGRFAELGVQAAAVEVSSAALIQERIEGLAFAVAGFTNLDRDHLDLHGSMGAYLAAKCRLFHPDRCRHAVVMVDDDAGREVARHCRRQGLPLTTCSSCSSSADWRLTSVDERWQLHTPDGGRLDLGAGDRPAFQRRNQMLAMAMLAAFDPGVMTGSRQTAISDTLGALQVPGRMQRVSDPDDPILAVVDYAHTVIAVREVIAGMRRAVPNRLITLLCADGERDPGKRHELGAAAAAGSDVVIVTETSNRNEDPAQIRAALLAGARSGPAAAGSHRCRLLEIPDRGEAIEAALAMAGAGDGVLLLGRGEEPSLDNRGISIPFLDRERLAAALRRRLSHPATAR